MLWTSRFSILPSPTRSHWHNVRVFIQLLWITRTGPVALHGHRKNESGLRIKLEHGRFWYRPGSAIQGPIWLPSGLIRAAAAIVAAVLQYSAD